jgi:hypothetical protein
MLGTSGTLILPRASPSRSQAAGHDHHCEESFFAEEQAGQR